MSDFAAEVKKLPDTFEGNSSLFKRAKRIHISLPYSLYGKITEAQEKTHADNITDVVRNALLVYIALVNERLAGNEVIVRSPDKNETKYTVFLQ
jgi:hypothetical protein